MEALPLAFVAYILVFGDLVTGNELIKGAAASRPDEKIDLNPTRSHISLAIRNAVMAIIAPFFPTQGALWTGVQVIVIQRWQQGRKTMDSMFDGIGSYFTFSLPLTYMLLPLITLVKPLMGVALAMTLLLTGIACANVALSKAKLPIERGVMVFIAVCLSVFEPWQGIIIGAVSVFVILGKEQKAVPVKPNLTEHDKVKK